MGVNNKRRRAAKQRRRTRPQAPRASQRQPDQPSQPVRSVPRADDGGEGARQQARAIAVQHVEEALRGLTVRPVDTDELAWRSRTLLRQVGPAAGIVHDVLGFLIVKLIDSLVSGSWDPTDLRAGAPQ